MKQITLFLVLTLLLTVGFAVQAQPEVQSYLIIGDADAGFASNVETQIARAGGKITADLSVIGVLVVESSHPNFASQIGGVQSIVANPLVTLPDDGTLAYQFSEPFATKSGDSGKGNGKGKGGKNSTETTSTSTVNSVTTDELAQPPFTGDDDFLFDLQWGHTPVHAQEAWAAGQRGAGVRVFILDEGFDLDHPDLAPNYNLALSTTFVPGTTDAQYLLPDTFSHGSHTSGTIGAADNAFGTIGVAPEVEMVPVKVLNELAGGSGAFSWVLQGIIYAAENGADVINMSLGLLYVQADGDTANTAALRVAVNRAITYAYQNGATVVVSAGNDAVDLNNPNSFRAYIETLLELEAGTWHPASVLNFNGYASHAVSISSVGTLGWALDPFTNPDNQSFYTNFGPEIDFAAPGGTVDFDLLASGLSCTVAGVTRPCYVFDFVFSTGNDGWYWSIGTSMAAPHAAGVAAIIIGENGGDMNPAQVIAEMRDRALDLGKSGQDDLYGHGRVTTGY